MKTTLLAVLIACFLSVSVSKSFSQAANVQDSLALVDLYDSTNGPEWFGGGINNWLSLDRLDTWFGVTVDNVSGRVTVLDLSGFQLFGTIPQSISTLTALHYLDVNATRVSGNSLLNVTSLSQLHYLNFSATLVTSIPASIGNLLNLDTLKITNGSLTGSIPPEIGNLSNLKVLDLTANKLTGGIPSTIGNLSNLEELYIDVNQCTGPIPPELGNLSKLKKCWLRNHLTGSIPSSLGSLTQLQQLFIPENQLTGYIPPELNNISATIYIYNNKLTFAGMELLATNSKVVYSPQAPIPIYNQNNTLFVAAGGTLSNDTFRLYKDGVVSATQIGDSTFAITETGKYNIVVTNAVATELTLYSDTLDLISLPITLTSFTANKNKTSVVLNWQTANEQNNAFFTIERSNNSNNNFKAIGRVNSKGNSDQTQQYLFEDFNPFSGGNYYRLKQVDKDGRTTYSKVVFIDFGKLIAIKLYPNPVKDVLTLEGLTGKSNISIINLQGSVLAKATTTNSTCTWNIKQLPAGTYYIKVEADKNVSTLRFVKE